MEHTYDSLKALIKISQSVSLPDSIPLGTLIKLAEEVSRNTDTQITIRVKNLGIEDLKRISSVVKGKISIFVEDK